VTVISQVNTLPVTDAIKCLDTLAVAQLNTIIETISVIQHEMLTLASELPEYPIVMLVCARLRHVAGTQWGNKKSMNMKHLETPLLPADLIQPESAN